jgi:chromosome segregation ATPase
MSVGGRREWWLKKLEQAERERDEAKKSWDYFADRVIEREKQILELRAEVERLREQLTWATSLLREAHAYTLSTAPEPIPGDILRFLREAAK